MFVDNDCASSVFLMYYDVSGLIIHCQFHYLKIFFASTREVKGMNLFRFLFILYRKYKKYLFMKDSFSLIICKLSSNKYLNSHINYIEIVEMLHQFLILT